MFGVQAASPPNVGSLHVSPDTKWQSSWQMRARFPQLPQSSSAYVADGSHASGSVVSPKQAPHAPQVFLPLPSSRQARDVVPHFPQEVSCEALVLHGLPAGGSVLASLEAAASSLPAS